jgi:all-trans-retinol 13,14-reductase
MVSSAPERYDAIVIGSGIGGLACGCALARTGYRVLVLEQHFSAGGLTQTFTRNGFTWDVGLHYLGEMGAGQGARVVLDWLSGGSIEFRSTGPVYETMHFPEGFEIQFARPEAALKVELKERFPHAAPEIDRFFNAIAEAAAASKAIFSRRAMPNLLWKPYGLWHGGEMEKWWGRTTAQVLEELISDVRLRAVLAGQRGDYAPDPSTSSFGMHALVMHHYLDGAYYPVDGSEAFARTLVPVIEAAGGAVRTRSRVTELVIENDAVIGVKLKDGTHFSADRVFSDAGARYTVQHLLPGHLQDSAWAREVLSFGPSACHIGLYLGLEGDIGALGATRSNHWFYRSWLMSESLWSDPENEPVPPALFVSFPSLKRLEPGVRGWDKHTAELVTFTDWKLFSRWDQTRIGRRPEDYLQFKRLLEASLLAQFRRHFPALGERIVQTEISTPLSTLAFTGAEHGAIYGFESSPRRFLSGTLHARTPVRGLFLTGQDVGSPGITGAMMGGVMAAAAAEPRVLSHLV